MASRSRKAIDIVAALAVALATAPSLYAQRAPVLLFTETEQIPLKTYAEFVPAGILRFSSGTVKDIPTVDTFRLIRCDLTGWRPVSILVASGDLFKTEYAERRLIPIVIRPVAVSAVSVRVADLERPERIASLHQQIGRPEGGEDAFFFLVLTSGDMTRYYPFRMRPASKP
jgi:hypothetical protein